MQKAFQDMKTEALVGATKSRKSPRDLLEYASALSAAQRNGKHKSAIAKSPFKVDSKEYDRLTRGKTDALEVTKVSQIMETFMTGTVVLAGLQSQPSAQPSPNQSFLTRIIDSAVSSTVTRYPMLRSELKASLAARTTTPSESSESSSEGENEPEQYSGILDALNDIDTNLLAHFQNEVRIHSHMIAVMIAEIELSNMAVQNGGIFTKILAFFRLITSPSPERKLANIQRSFEEHALKPLAKARQAAAEHAFFSQGWGEALSKDHAYIENFATNQCALLGMDIRTIIQDSATSVLRNSNADRQTEKEQLEEQLQALIQDVASHENFTENLRKRFVDSIHDSSPPNDEARAKPDEQLARVTENIAPNAQSLKILVDDMRERFIVSSENLQGSIIENMEGNNAALREAEQSIATYKDFIVKLQGILKPSDMQNQGMPDSTEELLDCARQLVTEKTQLKESIQSHKAFVASLRDMLNLPDVQHQGRIKVGLDQLYSAIIKECTLRDEKLRSMQNTESALKELDIRQTLSSTNKHLATELALLQNKLSALQKGTSEENPACLKHSSSHSRQVMVASLVDATTEHNLQIQTSEPDMVEQKSQSRENAEDSLYLNNGKSDSDHNSSQHGMPSNTLSCASLEWPYSTVEYGEDYLPC